MSLSFQNYATAYSNPPAQRVSRDRSQSFKNIGDEISNVINENNMKKERLFRESLLSDSDKSRVIKLKSEIGSLKTQLQELNLEREDLINQGSKTEEPVTTEPTIENSDNQDNEFNYEAMA